MARNYTRKFYTPIKLIGKSQVVGTPTVTVLEYDGSGKVLLATGATVPTDADAGYAKGCLFIKTSGSAGSTLYLNEGSSTSADFNVVESAASTVTGVTAGAGLTGGGSEGSVTVDVGAGTGISVAADAVALATGYTPSHVVKYAGKHTWTGSGATAQAAVSGVAATDIVVATIQTKPTQAAYLVGVVPGTNTIDFELSAANTSNDAVIAYTVFRAVA